MRKKNKIPSEKYSERIIRLISFISTFAGVAILFGSSWMNTEISYNPKLICWWRNARMVDFLSNFGSLLITIGIGTALYSFFDFVNYVQRHLKNVVIDYNFTDCLNDNEKEKLICKLQKEVNKQNETNDLYDFAQAEVLTLANRAHYEDFTLVVKCYKENNRIIKDITEDYVVNCINEDCFDIGKCCMIKLGSMKDNKCIVSIKELTINGQQYGKTDYNNGTTQKRAQEVYNQQNILTLKKHTIKKIIKHGKKINNNTKYHIRLKTKTDVSIDDLIYAYRLYRPSKKTTFIFQYNSKDFEVLDALFTFKDFDMLDKQNEFVNIIRENGIIRISIDEWILPGDGVIFILSPKK